MKETETEESQKDMRSRDGPIRGFLWRGGCQGGGATERIELKLVQSGSGCELVSSVSVDAAGLALHILC